MKRIYSGELPENPHLAVPYVAFQPKCSDMYSKRTGLIKGTIYKNLNYPFKGYENTKEFPEGVRSNYRASSFSLHDLALYLITHPHDDYAINQYNQLVAENDINRTAYENKYGNLTNNKPIRGNCYNWNNGPWPWENAANEVK